MKFETVLLDMDGTLINNDRNRFGAEYIKLVYKRFPPAIPFPKFEKAVYSAFMAMTENDGSKTNQRVFEDVFFPLINFPTKEGIRLFDQAHRHDFAVLQKPEERIPAAQKVVQEIFALGLQVVIATNPIFPKDIMYERLRWAEVETFPFDLVTSYEDSHYAKPNPLYYQEILTKIGARPEHTLMVGDEHMDMVAAMIGIETFFVESASSDLTDSTPQPTYRGELTDLIDILQ